MSVGSDRRKNGNSRVADVNIQGIFGDRFLKESFTLDLRGEVSLEKFFSKIDSRLRIRFFKKNFRKLSDQIVILINGQPVRFPSENKVSVKDGDQISILRTIAGG